MRAREGAARKRTTLLALAAALALGITAAALPPTSEAQDRSTIVRVLRESSDFRARVRAAVALGSSADPAMAGPLAGALSDREPAVRAAAATGLGRIGNPEALPSLRRALRDPAREVREAAQGAIRTLETMPPATARAAAPAVTPTTTVARSESRLPSVVVLPPARDVDWRTVRYVVVLGALQNRSGFETDRLSAMFAEEVRRHLVVLRGVATLTDGAIDATAEREIARRRLPKVRLEGSVNRVQRQSRGRDLQVRCEVSLMVMDEPGRNIRAALNGAATGTEPASGARAAQETRLAGQALAGAVRSAMSGAAQAIASARPR